MVYLIARSHYYGGKTGGWHLCLDEDGEPLTFQTTEEGFAYMEQCPELSNLTRKEHKREYQLVGQLEKYYIEREKTVIPRTASPTE